MKLVHGAFGVMDVIEGIGYVIAFFVVVGLLMTGHPPHHWELWAGAGLGALLLLIIFWVVVQRGRGRDKS